jgi:hypothetical protein
MKLKLIPIAFIASVLSTGAMTASAQPLVKQSHAQANSMIHKVDHRSGYGYKRPIAKPAYRSLQPYQVRQVLYRQGFRDVQIMKFDRSHYTVRATGYRGPVLLKVARSNGQVLSRTVLHQRPVQRIKPGFGHGFQNTHRFGNGTLTFYFGG